MSDFVTAIDLGSNSFRVLNYDFSNNKILNDYHEVVGMADGLVDTGKISPEAQERVINAIKTASKQLEFNPQDAIAVTTAAMRYASNNQEVLKNFQEQTGINFKIIEANEEARLTLLAIEYALKREGINSEKFIVLDIGGGSTEVIIYNHGKVHAKSFPFGIVTLTQKYDSTDGVKKELLEQKKSIVNYLEHTQEDLKEFTFISTAGTPTTVAAVKLGLDAYAYDRDLVNGTTVNLDDLKDVLTMFKNKPFEELSRLVGKGRVEFIEVGILIFQTMFEALGQQESIVFDDGLREGVAIDYCLRQ